MRFFASDNGGKTGVFIPELTFGDVYGSEIVNVADVTYLQSGLAVTDNLVRFA